jgi:anti-sigma factor RsiW
MAGLPDDVHARLSAYLDGELDAAARAEVEALLQRSPQARAVLAEMRRLDASLRSGPVPEPGDAYWRGFADRVASRLASSPAPESLYERSTAWLFRGGRVAWLRAAGALAMLTLVAMFAARGVRTPTPPTPDAAAPQASAPAPAEPDVAAHRGDLASDKATAAPRAPDTPPRSPRLDAAPQATAPAPAAPDLAAHTRDASSGAPPALDAGPPEVAMFVEAALDGRRDAALAALAQVERSHAGTAEVASMRAWVEATAPDRSPPGDTARHAERATAKVMTQSDAPAPSLPALQALDALVWPRRTADATAVERLALQLEALAPADTAARPLARRYFAWLAEASPDSAAARTWHERLRALDG